MRGDQEFDSTVIELLPHAQANEVPIALRRDHTDNMKGLTSISSPAKGTGNRKGLVYASLVVLSSAPILILAILSPTLSHKLAYNGCMPNGDFQLPFTASIWDPSHFFTITLAFTGKDIDCSVPAQQSAYQACRGYSFAQVKVIDLAWDVLLGRGGQAILVWMAYRLFSKVIAALMDCGDVGYDLFASIAFNSGTSNSGWTLLQHAAGWTPLPRSRRAMLTYAAMTAATIYIVAMPTLFSAMTGYASYSVPFVSLDNSELSNVTVGSLSLQTVSSSLHGCDGYLLPAWGYMGSGAYVEETEDSEVIDPTKATFPGGPIDYNHPPQTSYQLDWIAYYYRYADIYERCAPSLDLSDCAAANVISWVAYTLGEEVYNNTIEAPLPGIITWPDAAPHYTHWDCAGVVVETSWLSKISGNATGECQAGARYAWGFSFLLTFLVSVLSFAFALIMYVLWLGVREFAGNEYGNFKDAVTMVTQAQGQYGEKVGEWSASTLQKEVVKGKQGMTTASARRRKASDVAFGDPLRGDWGGDAIEEE